MRKGERDYESDEVSLIVVLSSCAPWHSNDFQGHASSSSEFRICDVPEDLTRKYRGLHTIFTVNFTVHYYTI